MRRVTMPKWLCIALCTAAFLLLLSALVEAPAVEAEPPAPSQGVLYVSMLPATTPAAEQSVTPDPSRETARALLTICCLSLLICLPASRDANGRVLRDKRYARSVYDVFRVELAAG